MKISVFGLGYVGAVSCGCLGELGHEMIGTDPQRAKVDLTKRGESPIIEEGLAEILAKVHGEGRLDATVDPVEAVARSDVALVCVGTPSTPSGGVNSSALETVSRQIGEAVKSLSPEHYVVLNRSTCLPPIHERMIEILEESSGRRMGEGIGYVCHPEFLREGAAVWDFYNPPKIVFGSADEASKEACGKLYPGIEAPTFYVSPLVASMVKYADNCFHAVKVTFGNEIGLICRRFGVDSHDVMDIFCRDEKLNISARYLKPGFAFGGSCLPKDLRAIVDTARDSATAIPMLVNTLESNQKQIDALLKRIVSPERPRVGIVGLAFKEGTDDVRESPLVALTEGLLGKGHRVRIYDKHLALGKMGGANLAFALQSIPHLAELLSDDLQGVILDSDVVVVSHRLSDEAWGAVHWRSDQRVIDLMNIEALRVSAPGYEGLYW